MVRRLPRDSTLSPMYHTFAAYQRIGTLLGEALRGAPLDAEGYARFSAIRETQPVSPTELARRLGQPTTTVLDAVRAMVDAGQVARLRNPRDGRSYLLRLTGEGERLHDETHAFFSEADRRLNTHLAERRDEVTEALKVLKEATEAALEHWRDERTHLTG